VITRALSCRKLACHAHNNKGLARGQREDDGCEHGRQQHLVDTKALVRLCKHVQTEGQGGEDAAQASVHRVVSPKSTTGTKSNDDFLLSHRYSQQCIDAHTYLAKYMYTVAGTTR
jgi:hypothetical protein